MTDDASFHADCRLDEAGARRVVLATAEASDAVALERSALERFAAELHWVPFRPDFGDSDCQFGTPRWLTVAPPARRTLGYRLRPGSPPADCGITHPSLNPSARYIPFWTLQNEQGYYCVVDAGLSEVVVAKLPSDRANARVRLVFFAALAIAVVSVTGTFTFAIGDLAMTAYRLLDRLDSFGTGVVALLLAAAVIGFWTLRLFKTLPGTLVELARQVATGTAALPTPQPELWLLRALGWTASAGALITLVGSLPKAWVLVARGGEAGLLVTAAFVGLQALLALIAFRTASVLESPREPPPAEHADLLHSAPFRIVRTVVLVSLAGLVGSIGGSMLELWRHKSRAVPATTEWVIGGAEIGAFAALLYAPLAPVPRLAAAIGIGVDLVLSRFHPLLAIAISLILVGVPHVIQSLRRRGPGELKSILWDAAAQSWAFHLGAVLGRLVGSLLGLFVLGIGGAAIGHVLGERLGGILGVVAASEKPKSA